MNRCTSWDIEFILFSTFHQKWTYDFLSQFTNVRFKRELLNNARSDHHLVSWWNVFWTSNHLIITTVSNFILILGAFLPSSDGCKKRIHRQYLGSKFTNHTKAVNQASSEYLHEGLIFLLNQLYWSRVCWTLYIDGWNVVNRLSQKCIGGSNRRPSAPHVQR
jgi:hypothetical protein